MIDMMTKKVKKETLLSRIEKIEKYLCKESIIEKALREMITTKKG
jgi:hypothetical protein